MNRADLTSALQHAISALLCVVLAVGLVVPAINSNKLVQYFKRAVSTVLVATEVGMEIKCYRQGLRAAMNQKHLHYPLGTLIYVLHALQLRYMKSERERNNIVFAEIDKKIMELKGMEGKQKENGSIEASARAEPSTKRKSASVTKKKKKK